MLPKQLFLNDLFKILHRIDNELSELGIQRKINLYSLGGTKLMIENFKSSSKDLDFIVSRQDSVTLGESFKYIERTEGVTIDLFYDGDISGYIISDYSHRAKKVPHSFKRIGLFCLDDTGFVITKAIAGRVRDLEEVYLFLEERHISASQLRKRFSEIELKKDSAEEITQKFEKFIQAYYAENSS